MKASHQTSSSRTAALIFERNIQKESNLRVERVACPKIVPENFRFGRTHLLEGLRRLIVRVISPIDDRTSLLEGPLLS
jgi:hypothetical protein